MISAKHFDIPIKNIFADTDISEAAYAIKAAELNYKIQAS